MPVRDSVPDITWDDYARQVTQGGNELALLSVESAGRFVCELYQDNPNALLIPGLERVTGIDARKALLDRMCRPHGLLPPPPPVPFLGGQCDAVAYQVRAFCREAVVSNGQIIERETEVSELVYGPIAGVRLTGSKLVISGGLAVKGFRQVSVRCRGGFSTAPQPETEVTFGAFSGDNQAYVALTNVTVTRFGGVADTCGNPAPQYPVKISPVTNYNNTVNITNNADINVTVPITIIPTLIAPVGINVNPEINVNVGGLSVKFGNDGINIENKDPLPPGSDLPNDPRVIPPAPIDNTYNDVNVTNPVDLTEVYDKLDELLKRADDCCDPVEPKSDDPRYLLKTVSSDELASGEVVLPEGTYKVRVLMTKIPATAKRQLGAAGATVYFAGHGWFSSGFSLGERLPIDAIDKQFIPYNKSQNSFIWSYNAGYKGVVTVYYRELR